ncbi:hypothetical protein GM418_10980 [Maribellus comscasis]|uniref:Uncharacterized protein n=1 Tax=Maribellus comscasis TaxID=2681766 RepID=A0A6I6JYE8_9BACT|nr:hypothetical protein [Maribellus comscasis]QGY44163.1 hypothetical protein GM418_10980 [Maribellus comscasis]
MKNEYFIKVSLDYSEKLHNHLTAISVFASSEEEAMEKTIRTVESWKDHRSYSILKISIDPIYIDPYIIVLKAKYLNGNMRVLNINLNAEDENEAEQLARKITNNWRNLAAIEIVKIEKRN